MKSLFTWMYMFIFLLLVPLGVLATNEQPFAPLDSRPATKAMVQERYAEMKKMAPQDPRRVEFFRLSLALTGFSENELDIIVKRGAYRIEPCGSCNLKTYEMIPDGKSKTWRNVTPTESVVFIIIDEKKSIPLFLPRCNNPVEEVKPKPLPPPPQATAPKPVPPPEPTKFKPVGCIQGAPLQLLGSSTIRSGIGNSPWSGFGVGDVSHHNNVIFYPTECISETDYQERDKEGKK